MKRSTSLDVQKSNKKLGEESMKQNSWKKLKLLLWKNYLVAKRNKVGTIVEVTLPLLFTLILLIVRIIIQAEFVSEPTYFNSFGIGDNPPYSNLLKCNQLYYAPSNEITDNLMNEIKKNFFTNELFEYNFTGFQSEEDLLEAYQFAASNNFQTHEQADFEVTVPVLAAVVFDSNFTDEEIPSDIQYRLRFPAALRGDFDIITEKFGLKALWYVEIVYPLFELLGPRAKAKQMGGLPGYYDEGFLYLQYAIDRTFIRSILNSSSEELQQIEEKKLKLQRFPYPPYRDDKYLFGLQGLLPLLTLLGFLFPVTNISKSIVLEKEKRLKESMKMMGLSNWLHWTAWFIKSFVILSVTCLITTIFLKVRLTNWQDVPILPNSDWSLIYCIFVAFSLSIISFCFFMSSMFSRANPAAMVSGAVWIIFYIPFAFLQPQYNLLPFDTKVYFCLFTNVPITFACQIISLLEGKGVGLHWSTLGQGASSDDTFSMAYVFLMMAFNALFYLFAAFYIEAVFPGEYGIGLPYNFFLKKWYWFGTSVGDNNFKFRNKKQEINFNVEKSTKESKSSAGIQIYGLTKKFGSKMAVKDLNLEIHEGEITALLGHNGAGKTTTISILTGLFPPSSGTAFINGYDIHRDMTAIRSSLGICPQHDVLFDELTVTEHLQFFCLLKGMEEHLVDFEMDRLVCALGLENKRDATIRTLSGGMKRKLSVLIAFCANSKVVLLDEATSGMDLQSRRKTWDLIQSEKIGRTIILSTHFLEEADVLGDRLAIMADGELQCCGSSLFLKKRYGGGYHLTIVKSQNCDVDTITNLLQQNIAEAEIDQNVGSELSYWLPDSKSNLFPEMFEELENKREALGIDSYGVAVTSMQEVFMRVLKDAELNKSSKTIENIDLDRNRADNRLNNYDASRLNSKSILFRKNIQRNSGLSRLCQQFWAMLTKKLIYAYRIKGLLIFQMLLPLFYLGMGFVIALTYPGLHNPLPFSLSILEPYETVAPTITVMNCLNTSKICQSYQEHVIENHIGINIAGSQMNFAEYILKIGKVKVTDVNLHYIIGYEERLNAKDNSSEIIGYFNNQPFHTPPLSLNFITNAMLRNTNHTVTIGNHPLPRSALDTLKEAGTILTKGVTSGMRIAIAISFLTSSFIVFLVAERESGSKHLQFVSGVRFLIFWAAHFIVDFIVYIIPCFGMLLVLKLFKMDVYSTFEMKVNFMVLLTAFGFAIIPFAYLCSFIASNPTTAYCQLVIINIFTGLAPMIINVLFSSPELNLEYLVNILNKVCMVSPNYAMGMGLVQLGINYEYHKICPNFNLEFICEAFPESNCCKMKDNYLDWDPVGIGLNIFSLVMFGCFLFAILFMIEGKIFIKIRNCFQKTKSTLNNKDDEDTIGLDVLDSDVISENNKIQKTDLKSLFKSHNVVIRDLTKTYGDFVAVDQINFGVEPGECFGLLGVNGAGKTTTFKQLTGDIPVSSGDAFICAKSVRRNIREVHEYIGYSPQFDGLIDELTTRETMTIFARLKGIPEKYITDLINELGEVLMFSSHLEKRVSELSGGSKRKLSTACALVGMPSVVLLDEPSTGMDPVARRHLWNAVSTIKNAGTSIVLTTHSLEEAENLCTRLAIMVNGKFKCLGHPQHLKNKFSKGYTLLAQTKGKITENYDISKEEGVVHGQHSLSLSRRRSAHLADLRNFIEKAFPGCLLKDIHPGFVHYHVMPSENINWGKMFAIMEKAKEKFNLEAYSVGQNSLEQLFLNFTKSQINNEDS